METKLERFEKTLDRAIFYLESDPKTNRKGAIEELAEVKELLTDLLVREKVYKAKATVFGIVGAAVFTILWKAIVFVIPMLK